jgi:hypothetical protein
MGMQTVRMSPPESNGDKPTSRKRTKVRRPVTSAKGTAWAFPKNTLEDAIRLAQAIEEKHAGKPIRGEELCAILGYKVNDWRFFDLLLSANKYELVTGSGLKATISLTDKGNDIVAPSSPAQRQKALLAAFNAVDQFKAVAEFYAGKNIPEDEYFANTLVREFNVPRERVEKFIEVFTANAKFVKAFAAVDGRTAIGAIAAEKTASSDARIVVPSPDESDGSGIRQFLDTCFVLMPFGEWFDRYYTEIYVPALKDAGFEPVRADSLFTSGSVMEQICEQIQKSKVLLAELTGKNPNVFYEMGVAHSLQKPVVFVSGDLDDVPFDVRHLRVVIYEVREPRWDEKLRKQITVYIKNARLDPIKSIPQPFRDFRGDDRMAEGLPGLKSRAEI